MDDGRVIVLIVALVLSLIVLFAQVKLFSIDATLKDVLKELRRLNEGKQAPARPGEGQPADSDRYRFVAPPSAK